MKRLLVVGFGPFPRVPRNPSGELARRIAADPRWRRLGVEAHALVLPTTYAALTDRLDPALASGPTAILMIGVAARARWVRVESRATNRASRLLADAAGFLPSLPMPRAAAPAIRASASAAEVLVAVRSAGLDARMSNDAGRYLCNASYRRALGCTAPAIFLHIPMPRTGRHRSGADRTVQSQRTQTTAFVRAALVLLRRARRQGVGTSAVRRSTESR